MTDIVLVTGAYDGVIRFWKAVEQKCVAVIDFETPISSLSISLNRQFVAAGGFNILKIFRVDTQLTMTQMKPDAECCFSQVLFNRQNDYLLATTEDNYLKGYDVRSLQCAFSYKNTSVMNTVCYQQQNQILTGDQQGRILQFDTRQPVKPVSITQAFDIDIGVRCLSSSTQYVSACDGRGILQLYDQNLKLLTSIQAHQDQINRAKLNPNNKQIASVGCDKVAKLWEIRDNQLFKTQEIQAEALDLDFNTSGQFLLLGSDRMPKLYTCEQQLGQIKQYGGHSKLVTAVALMD